MPERHTCSSPQRQPSWYLPQQAPHRLPVRPLLSISTPPYHAIPAPSTQQCSTSSYRQPLQHAPELTSSRRRQSPARRPQPWGWPCARRTRRRHPARMPRQRQTPAAERRQTPSRNVSPHGSGSCASACVAAPAAAMTGGDRRCSLACCAHHAPGQAHIAGGNHVSSNERAGAKCASSGARAGWATSRESLARDHSFLLPIACLMAHAADQVISGTRGRAANSPRYRRRMPQRRMDITSRQ